MHLPEMPLCSGRFCDFGRVLRVWMDVAHREVSEREAELVAKHLQQSIDDVNGGTAVRTFEVAVLDQGDQRRARAADVVVRIYWRLELSVELRNHGVVPLRECVPRRNHPELKVIGYLKSVASPPGAFESAVAAAGSI